MLSPFLTHHLRRACLLGVDFQEGVGIRMEREEQLQMRWVLGDKQACGMELRVMTGAEIWPVAARWLVVIFFYTFPPLAKFPLKRRLCQLC